MKSNDSKDLKRLISLMESAGFSEFIQHLRSPWRIMWTSFLSGIFRGLGIIVGMTIVFALLIWLLGQFVDFPLIGQYFQDIKSLLEQFTTQKNVY